jgi:hypothetical protein
MSTTKSNLRVAAGMALLAGIAVLSGCGPAPYSHSTASEQTTVTTPAPMVTTTTSSTHQDNQSK